MIRGSSFVIALAFQAACGVSDPEDPRNAIQATRLVVIDVLPEIVSEGEPFQIRIENRSNRAIGYNLCFRTLERRMGDRWTEVEEDSRICPAFLAILLPHETLGGGVATGEIPDGIYRLVFEMSVFPEGDLSGDVPLPRRDRTSDTFVVD